MCKDAQLYEYFGVGGTIRRWLGNAHTCRLLLEPFSGPGSFDMNNDELEDLAEYSEVGHGRGFMS